MSGHVPAAIKELQNRRVLINPTMTTRIKYDKSPCTVQTNYTTYVKHASNFDPSGTM